MTARARLPFLLSVPHAGLSVPSEAERYCILDHRQIVEDGDEGAFEIYDLALEVQGFVTTDVARAIVDMNRAEDDRSKDGVIKTHTCWDVPVYREPLPLPVAQSLLANYYRPYHEKLVHSARTQGLRLAIDCHTMAAVAPPVAPDPGQIRPWICLSNANGTCPEEWIRLFQACFQEALGGPVKVNDPFRGGYITRTHAREMPWLQLEMSRGAFLSNAGKRNVFLTVLNNWLERMAE